MTIPLDLERRFEQRWAARFQRPVEHAAIREHIPDEFAKPFADPRDVPAVGAEFTVRTANLTRLAKLSEWAA